MPESRRISKTRSKIQASNQPYSSHPHSQTKTKTTKPKQPRQPTAYEQRVYNLCIKIPPGRVTTYGALAAALNSSPRAAGQALRRNPYAPHVPCHRVISATLEVGGFSGSWGRETASVKKKIRLLREEGVEFDEKSGRILDDDGGRRVVLDALQLLAM
jgi:methylated-DNA-[protein]-cysteine S-methyltransferase